MAAKGHKHKRGQRLVNYIGNNSNVNTKSLPNVVYNASLQIGY